MKFRSEKWRMEKLGDIFKISSGGTPSKNKPEYYENGIIPWVRTGDLKDKYITKVEGSITEKALNNSSAKLFPANTVLIAMYGATIGACSILSVEAATNQACAAFLPNKEVDSSYMYYFLRSKKDDFVEMGVGGAQPNISATILKGVIIPLPPLETQKQIAKTLDTAAELLGMRKQQLAELDNLVKSTFYDMFGDPVRNEKGWEVEKLGSVLKESPQNGLYKPSGAYTNGNLGTPILRIDSFYDGELKQPLTLKRLNCTQKEVDLYCLYENDVVINRVNSIEYLGKCAHITGLVEETVFESNMMRLKIRNTINSKYLTIFLCTPYIYNQILSHAKKAVNQASINQKDVQDFDILVPPLSLQTQFASIVAKIEEQKALVTKAIDETQYLLDSLMSEYFE